MSIISILFFVAVVVSPSCMCSFALGDCIPSGTEVDINAALTGVGSTAILCAGALFLLDASVLFTAANQQIYTTGLPTDNTRAILRVNGSLLATAINAAQPGTIIGNIQVDGNRPDLGPIGNRALIEIGGDGSGQIVDNVYVHDPRGGSCLHLFEGSVKNNIPGCKNATITNNQVGPAGSPDDATVWAHGISVACSNSVVRNNVITDVTNGGIVLFGAPGSIVQNNTILAVSLVLLGGINMVNHAPVNGNYAGTQVMNNTINAQGALIKVGIAMGPGVWTCDRRINTGGKVVGNTLAGSNFGYGYPVNGVSNWTVSGNVDNARHVGIVGPACGGQVSQPAGFQYQNVRKSSLQSGYVEANLTYLLGLSEPSVLTILSFQAPTSCGIFLGNQGLLPGQTAESCDARYSLTLQTGGNLVLMFDRNTVWSTGTSGYNTAEALMQLDGNFVLYDTIGHAVWASTTYGNPGATLEIQTDGNLVIYSTSRHALWASGTCCQFCCN